jgi:sugar phosphate isomerase/epimerase
LGALVLAEFGLIHYNFKGTLDEFLDYARDAGFRCTELPIQDIWNEKEGQSFEAAKQSAARVAEMLTSRGLRASAISAGNNFLFADEKARQAQIDRLKQVCELVRIVGTSLLRIDGGSVRQGMVDDRQLHLNLIVEALLQLREFIEAEGFRLALDNHGMVTNDADFQIEIFKRVDSKNLGANVDTMNYRWAGHDMATVRSFYEKIAPYAFHTHCKDGTGCRNTYVGSALGEGEIPLAHAVKCLKDAGYKGPWVVEYEGKTDAREGYRKGLEWLKAHV